MHAARFPPLRSRTRSAGTLCLPHEGILSTPGYSNFALERVRIDEVDVGEFGLA